MGLEEFDQRGKPLESQMGASGDSALLREVYGRPEPETARGANHSAGEQQTLGQNGQIVADDVMNASLSAALQKTAEIYGDDSGAVPRPRDTAPILIAETPQPQRIPDSGSPVEMVKPVGKQPEPADQQRPAEHAPLEGGVSKSDSPPPIDMVKPVPAPPKEAEGEKAPDKPRLEANAEALLWDEWNKHTLGELKKNVVLDRSHPDLTIPREYAPLAKEEQRRLVEYDVTVQADGTIAKIELVKASGSAYFDNQVKRGVEHMGSSGKLEFPEQSTLESRTIRINYGWNWKPQGQGYPKGQVEIGGQLEKTRK